MDKKKKHIDTETDQIIQRYLDELSRVKLLDKYTLLRLHQNIKTDIYIKHDILNSISSQIINDPTIN
jgi:hypothetical protein